MIGEYELIRSSIYKDLVDSLNGLYISYKLSDKKMEPLLIKFHDQVEGTFGWNIFFDCVKFNLGVMNYFNNKMIISLNEVDEKIDTILTYLDENFKIYNLKQQEKNTSIVIDINFNPNKQQINKIIKLLQLVINDKI